MTFVSGQILSAADLNTLEGSVASMIVFTASGSLTAAQVGSAKALRVRVQAAGGGGAGAPATAAGQNSAGGHGSGGGYAESVLAVSSLVLPVAVTVGAAGAAGLAGANGGNAVASSFGTYVAANGGIGGFVGGPTGTAVAIINPNSGGQGTVGQITGQGGDTGAAIVTAIGSISQPPSGSSVLGGGLSQVCNVSANGKPGWSFGSGGVGAINMASQAARVGGLGGVAVVIIELIF